MLNAIITGILIFAMGGVFIFEILHALKENGEISELQHHVDEQDELIEELDEIIVDLAKEVITLKEELAEEASHREFVENELNAVNEGHSFRDSVMGAYREEYDS